MPSIEEYVAAGLYDPDVDDAVGRLELLDWVFENGFSIDEMVEGMRDLRIGAMVGERRLLPGERLGRAEAASIAGVGESELDSIATAFGFLRIDNAPAGEVGFTRQEAKTIGAYGRLAEMFTQQEALAFLRVVGSAVGRIGDAVVSMFLADVEARMLETGVKEIELGKKVDEAIALLDGFAEQLDPVLRRHVLQAIDRSRSAMIDLDERLQYRYAVGFVDLVGFTEIAGRMEPRALADFLREFEGRAHDVATAEGARVVKLIGDEVMFASTDPNAACRAANALMDGFGTELDRVVPRGGLAFGDVLVRGGDYYGPVVNLASRLVDEAVPRELLVTSDLADAAADCLFEPAGRRMVKGFHDPVSVQSFVSG